MKTTPTLDDENALAQEYGLCYVAGLDEAGRGALAGPVVAAAVILPRHDPARLALLHAVNDSKQLTARARAQLYDLIVALAVAWGVAAASSQEIDEQGIVAATRLAMRRALTQLNPAAEGLVIDGIIRLATVPLPQQAIVRGDGRCLSIAAASILAKVSRDREMVALDPWYPQFNFPQHKGYGTAAHLAALAQYGPTPIHRHSFAPLRPALVR